MKTICLTVILFLACLLRGVTLADDQIMTLFEAVRNGNVADIERCLVAGANLNSREVVPTKPRLNAPPDKKETSGDTPLIIAAQSGRLEVVKLLLARGANINLSGDAGYTPLMEALRRRHPEIAIYLMTKDANPNVRNDKGDTALIFASDEDNISLVAALLDHGANINGGISWTPLMLAAYNGRENIVKLLLKRGAYVNLHRGDTRTPLECALAQGHDRIALLLRKSGGKRRSAAAQLKDAMQVVEGVRAEAARRQAKALLFREERVFTPEDQEVVETALTDMCIYQGKDGFRVSLALQELALINVTADVPGLISDDQLDCELDVAQANDITRDMREHLQQRNWVSTPLKDFKPRNVHVIWIKEETFGSWFNNFWKEYPHARGWVQLFLPTYSKSHDAVVLRFAAGPSAHDMAGTYFLVKVNDKWHVKWRRFTRYA